jgi:hypothetical protein
MASADAGGNGGAPAGTGGSATGGAGGAAGGGGAGGGSVDAGGAGLIALSPARGIITGVRGVTTTDATQVMHVINSGQAQVSITALGISGPNQALFQVTSPPSFPVALAAGGDLPVTIRMLTTGASLPAAPPQDSGATLLSGMLDVTSSAGPAHASLFGLVLTQAIWEPTLGEILTTLGYAINVGMAQNNANPNRGKTVQQLPGVEAGTDEVAAPLFVKAGTGNVTLTPAARFSPMGPFPFGWYAAGASGTRNMVGTMEQVTDPQTSNKARIVEPPLAAGSHTTFDPGTSRFGIWVFTDELSQTFDTGTATNGDYDYSEDALNSPANVHRFKAYPLKDAAGAPIPNSFLLAVEEASNGDYQDFVFVLGNARVAP